MSIATATCVPAGREDLQRSLVYLDLAQEECALVGLEMVRIWERNVDSDGKGETTFPDNLAIPLRTPRAAVAAANEILEESMVITRAAVTDEALLSSLQDLYDVHRAQCRLVVSPDTSFQIFAATIDLLQISYARIRAGLDHVPMEADQVAPLRTRFRDGVSTREIELRYE